MDVFGAWLHFLVSASKCAVKPPDKNAHKNVHSDKMGEVVKNSTQFTF